MEGVISGIQIVGGGGYGSLLYLLDNDPHWILPIGSGLDVLIGGGALTIEFCYPTLNEVASQDPSSAGRQRDGEVASGQLLNQLLEARTRIADLERSISWRITGPLRAAWASLRRGSHPT